MGTGASTTFKQRAQTESRGSTAREAYLAALEELRKLQNDYQAVVRKCRQDCAYWAEKTPTEDWSRAVSVRQFQEFVQTHVQQRKRVLAKFNAAHAAVLIADEESLQAIVDQKPYMEIRQKACDVSSTQAGGSAPPASPGARPPAACRTSPGPPTSSSPNG